MSNFEIIKLVSYVVMLPIWCYLSLVYLGRQYADYGWKSEFEAHLLFLKKNWGYLIAFTGGILIIHSVANGAESDAFSCALLTAWGLSFHGPVIDRVRGKLSLAA